MSDNPTQGLTAETRELLAAVLEAIDVPYAASAGHEETRARIMDKRIMQLKVSLRLLSDAHDRGDRYMDEKFSDGMAYLRERLAELPPTGYVTDQEARERVTAGASWADAVRLDYDAPAVPVPADEQDDADEGDGDGDEGDVPTQDEQDGEAPRHLVEIAEDIVALSRQAPWYGDLAEQARRDGDEQAAGVFDTARTALEAIGTGNGLEAELTASLVAMRDAVTVIRAAAGARR